MRLTLEDGTKSMLFKFLSDSNMIQCLWHVEVSEIEGTLTNSAICQNLN